ncbi:MAG: hypothetical protein L6R37_008141 [Teloschistes peruensis]|nr:MAG: hypothetical protein L6R37_008141 [Teloschistes peruensis]
MADMFVARIAKDSRGLEHSSQSIAEAIAWSSTECKADIICMSFGFNEEEIVANSKPVRQAIRQAALDRHERILLFAAAGNEGANLRHVMFPARHDLVIPIYGTDARGAFVEDLNPRIKRDGPAIFGTLAKDVPCAGLSDEAEVYASGTSFATAIAAGLAGMLLEYVQLLALKRRESDKEQHDWKAQLSTRRGMLAMFQQMAEQPPDRRYYLHPIHYFQQTEDARQASIVLAARSPN